MENDRNSASVNRIQIKQEVNPLKFKQETVSISNNGKLASSAKYVSSIDISVSGRHKRLTVSNSGLHEQTKILSEFQATIPVLPLSIVNVVEKEERKSFVNNNKEASVNSLNKNVEGTKGVYNKQSYGNSLCAHLQNTSSISLTTNSDKVKESSKPFLKPPKVADSVKDSIIEKSLNLLARSSFTQLKTINEPELSLSYNSNNVNNNCKPIIKPPKLADSVKDSSIEKSLNILAASNFTQLKTNTPEFSSNPSNDKAHEESEPFLNNKGGDSNVTYEKPLNPFATSEKLQIGRSNWILRDRSINPVQLSREILSRKLSDKIGSGPVSNFKKKFHLTRHHSVDNLFNGKPDWKATNEIDIKDPGGGNRRSVITRREIKSATDITSNDTKKLNSRVINIGKQFQGKNNKSQFSAPSAKGFKSAAASSNHNYNKINGSDLEKAIESCVTHPSLASDRRFSADKSKSNKHSVDYTSLSSSSNTVIISPKDSCCKLGDNKGVFIDTDSRSSSQNSSQMKRYKSNPPIHANEGIGKFSHTKLDKCNNRSIGKKIPEFVTQLFPSSKADHKTYSHNKHYDMNTSESIIDNDADLSDNKTSEHGDKTLLHGNVEDDDHLLDRKQSLCSCCSEEVFISDNNNRSYLSSLSSTSDDLAHLHNDDGDVDTFKYLSESQSDDNTTLYSFMPVDTPGPFSSGFVNNYLSAENNLCKETDKSAINVYDQTQMAINEFSDLHNNFNNKSIKLINNEIGGVLNDKHSVNREISKDSDDLSGVVDNKGCNKSEVELEHSNYLSSQCKCSELDCNEVDHHHKHAINKNNNVECGYRPCDRSNKGTELICQEDYIFDKSDNIHIDNLEAHPVCETQLTDSDNEIRQSEGLPYPDIIESSNHHSLMALNSNASVLPTPDILQETDTKRVKESSLLLSNNCDRDLHSWNLAKQEKANKSLTLPNILKTGIASDVFNQSSDRVIHVPLASKVIIPVILKDPILPKQRKQGHVINSESDLDELKLMADKLGLSHRRPSVLQWKERLYSSNMYSLLESSRGDTEAICDYSENNILNSTSISKHPLTMLTPVPEKEEFSPRYDSSPSPKFLQDTDIFNLDKDSEPHSKHMRDAHSLDRQSDYFSKNNHEMERDKHSHVKVDQQQDEKMQSIGQSIIWLRNELVSNNVISKF